MKISSISFIVLATFALLFNKANGHSLRNLYSCPTPSSSTKCTAEENAVKCGPDYKCQYANECIAQASGFNPSYCQPVEEPCPIPTANNCPYNYDPVECQYGQNHYCQYDNECISNAAGFTGCPHVYPNCPAPTPNSCPYNYDPVKCWDGAHECQYDNECIANAAGFVGCWSA